MISIERATTLEDLKGILELQKQNLPINLTLAEKQSQGFVTLCHSLLQLQTLNDIEQHVIAKVENKVIGYLLAMTSFSQFEMPILIPMFDLFKRIIYNEKPISSYNYLVVGQVCIDKNFRGEGLLDKCYTAYKMHYHKKYDFAITEIDQNNMRSLKAHKRIGFKEIDNYTSNDGVNWVIVLWDWNAQQK